MTKLVEHVDECLDAIRRTDGELRAWVAVDEEGSREQARIATSRLEQGEQLPLAGVTVGVKDVFDVAGLPTEAGFKPFSGKNAESDSHAVACLRAAGAIIVGKTVTVQFAAGDPAATRNPWNLERTPGGSSSGSGAAVAARQVDAALGTQTAGSVLRPAAFCGAVGLKPGFGWTSRSGLMPLASSLDHVGVLTRSVTDAARLYDAMARPELPRCGDCQSIQAPRIGTWSVPLNRASASAQEAFAGTIQRFRESGATIAEAPFPYTYQDLLSAHTIIMRVDAATAHQRLFARYPDDYSPKIRNMVETGKVLAASSYARALAIRDEVGQEIEQLWSGLDVVALPTTNGGAPTPETTGDPSLQAVATLLGLPSITLPNGRDGDGMPLGIQLVGTSRTADTHLLRCAQWVEHLLPELPNPPHGA